jgi:aminopeptidase N
VRRTLLPLATLLLLACSSSSPSTSSGTGGGGGSEPPPVGPIDGAVTKYTYAFDLQTGHGRVSADVAVKQGGDCFTIGDRAATTTNPLWNGGPAPSATPLTGALEICGEGVRAGAPLSVGAESDVLQKTFLGLDVGFSRKKDQDGGDFTYLLSWVGGCDRFGICDADPSRLAAFHFDITHAPGAVVLCPGKLTSGDTVTSCDLAGTLAPTYSAFGLAADPLWKRAPFTSAAGLDLVFYETPSGQLAKSLDAASVGDFLTWITTLLGPFPYGNELRVAGGPTVWLGFEHPANIVLMEDLPTVSGAYENPTLHTLLHEIGHQWAGDRVTIATASDFVWKEATVEYLTYVFEDEHRPATESAASLAYWDAISLQSSYFPRPTDDPPPAVEKFFGDVYGPGPMTLYVQLESMFGRQAILAGIKSFLAEPGARTVAELRDALAKSTGQDLSSYFDAWVFGKGKPEWPTFAIATAQAGDQVTVTLTQQNASGKLYGCKVEVEVDGATSKAIATIDFGAAPKSATATATVTLAEPVVGTVLDPGHRLVARVSPSANAKAPAAQEPKRRVWIL